MYTLPEVITTKFNELFDAINQETDELKISAAEASLIGDFSQIVVIQETYRKLQEFEVDIKSASNNFESKHKTRSAVKAITSRNTISRTRKQGGRLRIRISGKVIEKRTIADTFVETLQVFGLERVAKLNKVVSAAPLIAKTATSKKGYPLAQKRTGNWYITTHVNKQNASQIIKEISKELNVPIQIEIVER